MPTAPSRKVLQSDLRLEVFAVVFALGTIFHELEFLVEQARIGPFVEYMERWSRVAPSMGWPSSVGLTLHLANVAISLSLMVLPWRRELLCLLTPMFFLSQLASPDRISSHSGLMAGGLLVVSILGAAEWLERLGRRARPPAARTDWVGWTLAGLACMCTLTYVFACFYKLNPVWFSSQSPAPSFLMHPIMPILTRVEPLRRVEGVLAPAAIYGTLVVEALLPFLLLGRRTWALGCFVGVGFHLPMLIRSVADFPTLIVAFYPAFATRAETEELLRRCRIRPAWPRLGATAALGAASTLVVGLSLRRISRLDASVGAVERFVFVANVVLIAATVVGLIHVGLTLGGWLLERLSGRAGRPTDAAGGRVASAPSGERGGAGRAITGRALAAATVLVVGAGFLYTNVAPFLGLPSAGAMSMYSGINAERSNHFLMPRLRIGDSYSYATIVEFEADGTETPAVKEFRAFAASLAAQKRPVEVLLNLVRYQMSRVCGSGSAGPVRLRLRTIDGRALEFEDVCAEPAMLRYSALPIGSRCNPECPAVEEWARGKLRLAE
jgi:hypothetical protein